MFRGSIYKNMNEIRQASILNRSWVDLKYSGFFNMVLIWLLKGGYIYSFNVVYKPPIGRFVNGGILTRYFRVYLKYLHNGRGVLNEIEILSKPTKAYNLRVKNMPGLQNGVTLVSTPCGLITSREAAALNVGGFALFTIRL